MNLRDVVSELSQLRREIGILRARPALIKPAQQVRIARTVPDPYTGLYPYPPANQFWFVFLDGFFPAGPADQGWKAATWYERQEEDDPPYLCHGLRLNCYLRESEEFSVFWHNRQWWYDLDTGPTRIRLAEDHPGRGIKFNVHCGYLNTDTRKWCFDEDHTWPCIDWWNSDAGPYPDECAQGWAHWEFDDDLGKMLHVEGLDCNAPDCEDCE